MWSVQQVNVTNERAGPSCAQLKESLIDMTTKCNVWSLIGSCWKKNFFFEGQLGKFTYGLCDCVAGNIKELSLILSDVIMM